jgi:uncharacterized protein (TIGR02421 family)
MISSPFPNFSTTDSLTPAPGEEPPGSRLRAIPKRALTSPETSIRDLSERLALAQRPLRILDSVHWDDEVEEAFFASRCRELPRVDRCWYQARPLTFDVQGKLNELAGLQHDVHKHLGSHPAGRIMMRWCGQLLDVVELLDQRGTPRFSALSRKLYGSSRDPRTPGAPSLTEMARSLGCAASFAEDLEGEERTLDASAAARLLSERLSRYFLDAPPVRVQLSASLAADASAGGDHLKVRADARFSLREVRLLEVHEGWVHLGTTRNGLSQPICTFLSKSLPAATVTQEGLAVLTEVLAFASHPARLRRLANRVEAVALAEDGADFLDVFRFFQQQGCDARASYQHTARIFRGSLPAGGGPFTKDLAYSKGFVQVFHHVRQSFMTGQARRIPLLFCGKTCLEDIPDLDVLVDLGLVALPSQVPPPFADLRALCAWVCCVGCLNA